MLVYDIKLYDLNSDSETVVIVLPERRKDYDRPRGRATIVKYARSLLGEDWWLRNWHNIVIRERGYHQNHRENGNGSKSEAPPPPKKGGVD